MITESGHKRTEKYTCGQRDDHSFLFWMSLGAFGALALPVGFVIVSLTVAAFCRGNTANPVCTELGAQLRLMFYPLATQGFLLIFAAIGRVLEKRRRRRYWSMRVIGIALYPLVTFVTVALAF